MLSADAALLAALRRATGPLAPSELCTLLGCSPVELAARLEELAAAGFDIERHPTRGCSLRSAPDRLMADDLWSRLDLAGLTEAGLVREILVLAETASTNDVAMRLGREGAAGGVLVLAEKQTAGRGRFGRRWESAPGLGIWMSLLLRPEWPMARWPRLTTWAGVAVAAAVERTAGERALVKWPNDVQVGGKKIAGILIEAGSSDGAQEPFAVVGIGLNAQHAVDDFPPELRELATSLKQVRGCAIDRAALVVDLLGELQRASALLAGEGFAELVAEATHRSSLLGRWIQLQTPEGPAEGLAEALDPEGCLILQSPDGTRHTLLAGEVTLRG